MYRSVLPHRLKRKQTHLPSYYTPFTFTMPRSDRVYNAQDEQDYSGSSDLPYARPSFRFACETCRNRKIKVRDRRIPT